MAGDLTNDPHRAGRYRRARFALAPSGPCPVCGTRLVPEPVVGRAEGTVIPQPIAAALVLAHTLSAREKAVFDRLGQGFDNRSIAREMSISERTVKRHVTVILAKLRLQSRLQAGLAAMIVSSISVTNTEWSEGRIGVA
ncbi:MAG: response regulator transcription factor [Trebonia sp.]